MKGSLQRVQGRSWGIRWETTAGERQQGRGGRRAWILDLS